MANVSRSFGFDRDHDQRSKDVPDRPGGAGRQLVGLKLRTKFFGMERAPSRL